MNYNPSRPSADFLFGEIDSYARQRIVGEFQRAARIIEQGKIWAQISTSDQWKLECQHRLLHHIVVYQISTKEPDMSSI